MVRTRTSSSREGIRSDRSVRADSSAQPNPSWATTRFSSVFAGSETSTAARPRARSTDMPADVPLDRTLETSGSWEMKRSVRCAARRCIQRENANGAAAARTPPAILPMKGRAPRNTRTTSTARASSVIAGSQSSPAPMSRCRSLRVRGSRCSCARRTATGPCLRESSETPRLCATWEARPTLALRASTAAAPVAMVATVPRMMTPTPFMPLSPPL